MASPVDTSVKFAYAEMVGAPTLSGTAGSLISTLDAFLISGFGLKSVDSAVISNGVCRLSFSSGASCADVNAVVLVAGAAQAGLNGEQKVTAFSTSWVEFKTALSDGPVTGAVSFKLAPLGWEKVFSKTNVAVYRSTDPAGTRPFIRVDDTGALLARVSMYESMTDVDTGFGMAPTATTISGGYCWWKRNAVVATGATYLLVGDSRGFYFTPGPSTLVGAPGVYAGATWYAGDIISYRSGDAYCALLSGSTATGGVTSTGSAYGSVFSGAHGSNRTLQRAVSGVGGAITSERWAGGGETSGLSGVFGAAPGVASNNLFLCKAVQADGVLSVNGPRGEMPGVAICLQSGLTNIYTAGSTAQALGTGQYSGLSLLPAWAAAGTLASTTNIGVGFFDVTGPWREV